MITKVEPSHSTLKKLFKIANILLNNDIKYIFEFGSRYGEDTAEFAKKYSNATVYAFECNPNTLDICRKRLFKYKNVILTEKAITEEDKTVAFFVIDKENTVTTWADGNQGASSLLKVSGKYEVEKYAQKEVTVEGITLNSFMQNNNIPSIDLLWMDIQGAELMALKGLKKKISSVKIIHLEVEFMEIYHSQPLFDEIKNHLINNNFRFVGFSAKGKYSADAIFVNNNVFDERYQEKITSILNQRQVSFIQTIKHKLESLFILLIKKSRKLLKKCIRLFVIAILLLAKKVRRFENSFPVYSPEFTSREIKLWYLKVIKPLFCIDVQFRKNIKSDIPIDIIIPTIKKDAYLLSHVIIAAKTQIKHPISNIFIIAPNDSQIITIAKEQSCTFINENSVLKNITKESIVYNVEGSDRSGWLFQQLLKLSGDTISTQEHFLILDSDTIFTRPVVFIHRNKVIFNHSDESHKPYYEVYRKIFGSPIKSSLSFVSHYMLWSKTYLQEMKNTIENKIMICGKT